jgi:MFS transporter, DHA2 family, multidrug resistance protein
LSVSRGPTSPAACQHPPPTIAVFTIASVLCGMATSLPQLILFRVIQGLGAGGLQPSGQAILLDAFPREEQDAAQTMFFLEGLH